MSPSPAVRTALRNRRESVTETVTIDGISVEVTFGFDERGRPREVFVAGVKDGATLGAILADFATIVSVALQHEISVKILAKSIARQGERYVTARDLDRIHPDRPPPPAALTGAVLDRLVELDKEGLS